MTDKILKILDDVRYWETCPDNYKKDIETFLKEQNQALRIHDVVGQGEQLGCHFCSTEDGKHGWTDDGEICPLDRTA